MSEGASLHRKVTVLIDACSSEFRDYMEFKSKDLDDQSAPEVFMNFAKRKREMVDGRGPCAGSDPN